MPITLRAAIASYPHAVALKDGTVTSDRVRFDFEEMPQITRAFRRMVRTLDFDLCEIALTTLAQAHAYAKPIVGLPVVLMRGFHHAALVCRRDARRSRGPRDLVGKRVGVRAWSQTTGIWLRGILQADYDVRPEDITWITAEDAHVLEYQDPPNVQRISAGQDLSAMLMAGRDRCRHRADGLDAAQLRTVIPDADAGRRRLVPPHRRLSGQPRRLREAGLAGPASLAGRRADGAVRRGEAGGARHPVPRRVGRPSSATTCCRMDSRANRRGIELCVAFAAQQGLIPRAYAPEDLVCRDN